MIPDSPPSKPADAAAAGSATTTPKPLLVPDHELLRRIGQGSYGEVWLGRNVLGHYRAIKVLYRIRFDSERPFEREFSGIKRFEPVSRSHEGFVDILQVGRDEEHGYFYHVMELADDASDGVDVSWPRGSKELDPERYIPRTLASELSRRGRLPLDECVQLGLSVASALGQLHQQGLVHRDIKPSNIIFVNGLPKLADIGLVASLNESHSFVGTEGFIPPEGPGSSSADLYSLGKVLYEISTGRDRQDFPQLPADFLTLPEAERTQLAEFNEVLLRACQQDPLRRYRNAAEMQAELALLRSGKSLQQMRRIERRLTVATRLGTALAVLALIAWIGYLFQQTRSQRFQRLAESNRRLADENSRLAQENRYHLARLQVANGQRLLEAGDLLGALPWYANALALERAQPGQLLEHQFRLASVIQQSPRLLHLWRHAGAVNSAQFSPDGRRIVTASSDKTVRLWDALTGNPITPPLAHEEELRQALFTPDGQNVVAIGSEGTRIWDAESGTLLHHYPQPASLGRAAISPDGRWLAVGGYYGHIAVRNLATGRELAGPWRLQTEVFTLAFRPDSLQLFAGSWGGAGALWDLETGTLLFEFKDSLGINCAEFSPDGSRLLTTHSRDQACLRSAQTGEPLLASFSHDAGLNTVRFNPAGTRIATASSDGMACLWNATNGHRLRELRHEHSVLDAGFSRDGKQVLTRDAGGVVQIWSADTGKLLVSPFRQGRAVRAAALDPTGSKLLIACEDGTVRLWDLRVKQESWSPGTDSPRIVDGSSSRARLTTQHANGKMLIWDAASWQPIAPPLAFSNFVNGAIISRGDSCLWLWTRAGAPGQRHWRLDEFAPATGDLMSSVDCPPAVTGFLTGSDGQCVFMERTAVLGWQPSAGKKRWGPVNFNIPITLLEGTADGRCVMVIAGTVVHVIATATGEAVCPPLEHPHLVSNALFSPDGRWIATACGDWETTERQAKVWEGLTGRLHATLPHQLAVWGLAFSRDGRLVATASSDQTARVWDPVTGKPLSPPLRHPARAFRVDFSPDSNWLAVSTYDERAWLWDWRIGELLGPPLRHESRVQKLQFLADGKTLLLKGDSGPPRLWRLPDVAGRVEDWLELAGLLSGAQCDATGSPAPLQADRLLENFTGLRKRLPEFFRLEEKLP